MASKLISVIHKFKLEKVIIRGSRNYFVQRTLSIAGSKQLTYGFLKSKNFYKDLTLSFNRLRSFKTSRRITRFIPIRKLPPKIKCPPNPFPGRFLNKGCSAAIISVLNPEFESKVILKQPYKYDGGDYGNECGILSKLSNHPNIIQLVGESSTDICQDPDFLISCPDVIHSGSVNSVILERMDMNLQDLLNSQNLTTIDRIDLITQILEAQVFMHNRSICHRDLKPANILVKGNASHPFLKYPVRFTAKVADFDCALDLKSEAAKELNHQGTPSRTAPEILNYKSQQNGDVRQLYAKSDVWSIGTIIYDIFNGENPFSKISSNGYTVDDLPPLQTAPNIIQKLVKCLLNPDPKRRYCACISSDILQLFRLKTILSVDVYGLFRKMAIETIIGCCYMHQMDLVTQRISKYPERLQFATNFIDNEE